MKQWVILIYLSLLVHLYLFFLANTWLSEDILHLWRHASPPASQEVRIDTIMIDNPNATKEKPTRRPKLSDVDSRSRGPVEGREEYNMLLPVEKHSPAPVSPHGQGETLERRPGPEVSGPLLYDPAKKPIVRMSSSGQIALESQAVDYAPYFKQMQQTIASNWQIYFPIFQYYQGVMADGVVSVTFDLDNEGNVKNVAITRDFGYESLNEASLRAVLHTSNYGPLPELLRSPEGIRVEFHFIYIRP